MKTSTIILGSIGSIILITIMCIIVMVSWYISVINTEVKLSNRYIAQYKVVETSLDKMRKVLINKFKVNKQFANDFIKTVQMQSKGREGGSLIKLNTESANKLGIDKSLYIAMSNSIECEMSNFKRAQDTWVDIWREHKTYCEIMPNRLFIGIKVKKEPQVISSSITKDTMKTKKFNDNLI